MSLTLALLWQQERNHWANESRAFAKIDAGRGGGQPRRIIGGVAGFRKAVRGAIDPHIAEPPPDFGQMSDQELREYTRKNFGF
jgi:hypothetical protein